MDSAFNPAFFQLRGRRQKILRLAGAATLDMVDFIRLAESFLDRAIRRRSRKELEKCRLTVLRDPESNAALKRCGFNDAVVGADSAILLPSAPESPVKREPGGRKIGFCISAQRRVADAGGIAGLWERLLAKGNTRLVLIPMNPKTDRELMADLSRNLDRTKIEWVNTALPEEVQAAAANCDVLVSSRLHLLILGGNVLTP